VAPPSQDHPAPSGPLEAEPALHGALPLVVPAPPGGEGDDWAYTRVHVALQIRHPELDGATSDPSVLSGRDDAHRKPTPSRDRSKRFAGGCIRWPRCATKPPRHQSWAITVFSFPPDKGNVGTAAYLDVFGRSHRVLEELKRQATTCRNLPRDSKSH